MIIPPAPAQPGHSQQSSECNLTINLTRGTRADVLQAGQHHPVVWWILWEFFLTFNLSISHGSPTISFDPYCGSRWIYASKGSIKLSHSAWWINYTHPRVTEKKALGNIFRNSNWPWGEFLIRCGKRRMTEIIPNWCPSNTIWAIKIFANLHSQKRPQGVTVFFMMKGDKLMNNEWSLCLLLLGLCW